MGRPRWIGMLGLLGLTGCTIDTSTLEKLGVPPPLFEKPAPVENPLVVPLNPKNEKNRVFEVCYSVLNNYGFDILESNRADGRIETATRIAPGVIQFFKPGSPDFHERLLASMQTYRNRVTVLIIDSKDGMYIDVQVRKELEDLARPIRSTIGASIFRVDNDLDRRYEVVDPSTPMSGWLYRGRDRAMEQELIQRMKAAL